ncbi:MAG: hypothetical protein A3H98_11895 [Bacteroidetes bacterium RIFCSPLOWO2_02_FULL_36_8]|nr:MAG: hypothetical protein A3H98_11895 [Bacteroidetes bacterium RIFCSPLOWO2_02_FULL_36_8]OFY69594.1 MAG: hypothetical protein A3G23_11135 [Bacteroidetes bacterium RIFCSPLOWO2_12_FULL_37_12]
MFFTYVALSQTRVDELKKKLDELSKITSGLNDTASVSVSNTPIQELLRAMADAHELNISVDPGLNILITYNFSKETVGNILLFLCKQYNLDILFTGSIMSVQTYDSSEQNKIKPAFIAKELKIEYDKVNNFLSFDLKNDSLDKAIKKIVQLTGKNISLSPELQNERVSAFVYNMNFDGAINMLSVSNDFSISKTKDNFYILSKNTTGGAPVKSGQERIQKPGRPSNTSMGQWDFSVQTDSSGKYLVSVTASDVPIIDIITDVSTKLKTPYFIFDKPEGDITSNFSNIGYDDMLNFLLQGTDYTFKKTDNIYFIGKRGLEGLRNTKVVKLVHRSADTVAAIIPKELNQNIQIQTFPELNSLIVTGSTHQISDVENFIRSIDKTVPMVLIEIIVIDVLRSRTTKSGIKAGIADSIINAGKILPEIDYTLSSEALNKALSAVGNTGIINLGRVTPKFYLSIQASENKGDIKIRSTPYLATLNGHSANMKIGETKYYLEEQATFQPIVGNVSTVSNKIFKSINADLSIAIKPVVSGDDCVTLDIVTEFSKFLEPEFKGAPPGKTTRQFKSDIRVKNDEMVMLGGLEEKSRSDTGSGVPFLSRIPIINWFFSDKTNSRRRSKLQIYIHPTIIYS